MSTADEKWAEYKDRPRSWSQLTSYEQCPHAFYLERIARVWQRPAAWFATGQAVHSAAEAYEKGTALTLDDMVRVAEDAFREDINERLEETPNAEYWQSSGLRYPGPVDIPRRFADLRRHLTNYLQVSATLPPIAELPEDQGIDIPAVEWPIDMDLDGVKVIGSADQVRADAEGFVIVDVKAGSKTPEDPGQLAVYAEAVRRATGNSDVSRGAYVMTAKKPTPTGRISAAQIVKKDLTTIPVETLTARFHAADEGIKAGNWDPKPGEQCGRCSVKDSCDFAVR